MPSSRRQRGPPKPSPTAYASTSILKSKSPLTQPDCDLHAFLLCCLASWARYTPTERRRIIAALPPAYRRYATDAAGDLACPLSLDFVRSDSYLRAGVDRFKRDVADGYFDATWRKNAMLATRERDEGQFDEYVREKVEMDFGEEAAAEEQESESSESHREWGRDREKGRGGGRGKGKNVKGAKAKVRPRDGGVRGEMHALAMDMEE